MNGYVYLMTNEAMPGLIKIGSTSRSPEERRRELSSPTGVPAEFMIGYEIFTSNMKLLERRIHEEFKRVRSNNNREFFRIDLTEAINVLSNKAAELRLESAYISKGVNEVDETYEAIEILGRLKELYPNMIREEIKSTRIYQTKLRCCLEIVEEYILCTDSYAVPLIEQKICRSDLAFIIENDDPVNTVKMFDPKNPIAVNARLFIKEFDAYSIVNCTDLFTKDAEQIIFKQGKEIG